MSGALLQATAELVNVSSVSHDERAIADLIEQRLRGIDHLEVVRIENNLVARTQLGRQHRVVLAGHVDTVPPADNATAEIRGEQLFGCGSADMKGGIAILMDLAAAISAPLVDVTYVLYACEEVARKFSGLRTIEANAPELLVGDVAVLLEPTSARIEAGCQGVLRIGITLNGARAHSARPWVGQNAIHRVGPLIERIAQFVERQPVIDGCTYHETLQVVHIAGGVAANVIPDEVTLVVSHRFAPDRGIDEAFAAVGRLLEPFLDAQRGDRIELLDAAPAARPSLDDPLLARVVRASGTEPVAKIGWTDVAFFYERELPAINFGPGDPLVAHSANEFVESSEIERVRAALFDLLSTP